MSTEIIILGFIWDLLLDLFGLSRCVLMVRGSNPPNLKKIWPPTTAGSKSLTVAVPRDGRPRRQAARTE